MFCICFRGPKACLSDGRAARHHAACGFEGQARPVSGIQSAAAEAIEMILGAGAEPCLPQRDYDFVDVGSNSAVTAALIAKRVDATGSYPPFSYAMEKQGFKILADEATYVPQYVTGMQIANRAWADKNRDVFIRLLKAIDRNRRVVSRIRPMKMPSKLGSCSILHRRRSTPKRRSGCMISTSGKIGLRSMNMCRRRRCAPISIYSRSADISPTLKFRRSDKWSICLTSIRHDASLGMPPVPEFRK